MTKLSASEIEELARLQNELDELQGKKKEENTSLLPFRIIEKYYELREKYDKKNPVKRKVYIWLCLLGVFGIQHFYSRHYVKGVLSLLFFWTGIPAAHGLLDILVALPMKPTESGYILI